MSQLFFKNDLMIHQVHTLYTALNNLLISKNVQDIIFYLITNS